jgi:hypothetical protein
LSTKVHIGSGGDFPDWTSAWNAIMAIGLLTKDYRLEQISDLTNSTVLNPSAARLNGRTIEIVVPEANQHNGVPTDGYKTYVPNNRSLVFPSYLGLPSIGGFVTIDGLNIISTQTLPNGSLLVAPYEHQKPNWWNFKTTVKNILIRGNLLNGGAGEIGMSICGAEWSQVDVVNCKISNCGSAGIMLQQASAVAGNPGSIINRLENITVYNCAKYVLTGIAFNSVLGPFNVSFKNIYCGFDNGSRPCYNLPSDLTYFSFDNCASSDASVPTIYGSNNLQNIAPVDEFESLVYTNADFLNLKKLDGYFDISGTPRVGPAQLKTKFRHSIRVVGGGEKLYGGGLVPVLSANDISGEEYGKYGYYPIGCHNAQLNGLQDVWEL